MINIYIDLDGTLLNVSDRLFKVFSDITKVKKINQDFYINLKNKNIKNKDILIHYFDYSAEDIELFDRSWHARIENWEYLKLDTPHAGVSESLNGLSEVANLYLLTNRKNKNYVLKQLKIFGFDIYFKDFLICEGITNKISLIEQCNFSHHDWIIGDTEHDVQVGKFLGIKTIVVLNGMRNKAILDASCPDLKFESFSDVVGLF